GSFGGLYGSRCTRFYYPAGILALVNEIPEAAALSDFMKRSIGNLKVVTLSSIDEPNLVPTFNSYCWAAVLADQQEKAQLEPSLPSLPALNPQVFRLRFEEAGLLIDRGEEHY